MKTYKQTIDKPRLVIKYDQFAENPRKQDTLGYFLAQSDDYKSPDGNDSELYKIMVETADEAENTQDHIDRIIGRASGEGIKIVHITPVYRYEHGNVVYRRGVAGGFDYSNCGFYIVTDETAKVMGTAPKDFNAVIDAELARYTQWDNGEVYSFTLYDEQGEMIDGYGDLYSLDEIKDGLTASYEGWEGEKMEDYLKN